jgi:hypothetical protein
MKKTPTRKVKVYSATIKEILDICKFISSGRRGLVLLRSPGRIQPALDVRSQAGINLLRLLHGAEFEITHRSRPVPPVHELNMTAEH